MVLFAAALLPSQLLRCDLAFEFFLLLFNFHLGPQKALFFLQNALLHACELFILRMGQAGQV